MLISGKHVSRRTVLRGAGVALGLPLLDSMLPAQTARRFTAAVPKARLCCIEMVHGAAGSTLEGARRHYWSPEREGTDFDLSYTLEPLAAFRDCLTIVSNTDAHPADPYTPLEGGADHFRSSAVFLTAAHPKQTAGPDVRAGISVDQLYAQNTAAETRLPSLQLSIENIAMPKACGFDYNCVYSETISWASPTQPLPMTPNPRIAFEQLFGRTRGSVVDAAAPAATRLKRALPSADRLRLEGHLAEIRSLEKRIEAVERRNALARERKLAAAPLGVPDSWEEHVRLMFDLQVLAFAADITRVSAFKMSRDTSNRVFAESGVDTPFHTLSHHGEVPSLIADFAKLNRYHVAQLPYFLRRLSETPDGEGSLLDHSMVLYGSSMGDSNSHNHKNVPLFLAGRACGTLKGSLHRVCPEGTPHANVLLTMLRKLGVNVASFGNSTGEVAI
ncbi:MAG TPA: DUF1552 domain-containing protein [Candidatus Limnocylindrales bacterium]|nr:DUF1552 domain-containing protein [Candidatus Limnocylindrales bacterium]